MSKNKIKSPTRSRRRSLWVLLAWTITGILLVLNIEPLYNRLWILTPLPIYGFVFIGILLFLSVIIYGIWRRQLWTAYVALGFIFNGLVLWLSAPYLAPLGDSISLRLGFIFNRHEYDKVVNYRLSADSTRINSQGIPYDLKTNSPLRVIFPQPAPFKDRESIVYDPAKSKIEHCLHIDDHYYYCGKTDFLDYQ